MYQQDPVAFAEDALGITPYPEQAELLQKVIRERQWTAWRSGHGPGKSTGIALIVLAWITLFPNSRVVCTAPKKEQIFDVVWAEIARILMGSKIAPDLEWTKTKVFFKGREQTQVALARTSRTPEAMAGQHATNMLFLFDEASGVASSVFEAAEGSQTTSGAVMLLTGNPTQTQGYFFDAFHTDRSRWHIMHTPVEHHPNVLPGYAPSMAQKWGLDSDVYRVRVLGEFPVGDPNTFIAMPRVEAAMLRDVEPEGLMEIGVDVARYGDDRTIVLGRQGLHVFKNHKRLARSSVPETIAAVYQLMYELRKETKYTGDIRVKVDDSGVGGGVTDGLRDGAEASGYEVVACNFGGAGNDEYDNEATIMWAGLRDVIELIELPDLEDLVGEVSLRRYAITKNGKIIIEPKAEFKKRVDLSPDYADALVLAFAQGQNVLGDWVDGIKSDVDWG